MEDELEVFRAEIEKSVEAQRRRVVDRITMESDFLVDELLKIIHSDDVDNRGRPIVEAKIKLSAIAMLLERGVPKLAVSHSKEEAVEETGTRKRMRQEIEELVLGDKRATDQDG